ncbi:hypothetical protein [Pelagicoccus sp. SDUM812002]|uniref:hypothetical protein n=1 Tax=Pelagicoccus sp. SDUM812002 TaxID=3041266 RepID=UPI00281077FE|nr:hypothetical protein [Pelagicoccus sp. SDUM812002]MDQ8187970.1 hypothetical protein [Pelagicoccus sp. SDUM812002]
MDTNRKYEVHRFDEPVKLRYPLEDWIEQLLSKYPDELATIRPERARQRSERLHKMQQGLRERAKRQLF